MALCVITVDKEYDDSFNDLLPSTGSFNNVITVTKDDSSLCISCTEGAEGAARTFDYKDLGGQC